MNVYEVKKMLQHKPITDIPLRVVSYCRVSTKSLEQATSIENQVEHYRKKIQGIPAWTFVGEYVDNGISGTSVKARVQFNKMIEDAENGKFDLIVTKAVSRFARNTLDSLMYSRKLLEVGVGIWFDMDGILNLDKDGELRLSIFSALAQDESAKKSEAVRFGQQEAIKRGTVFGFDNMFGFRKRDGKLEIDESEAPAIRKLFELYATDQYSMKQIEKILYDDGFRNHKGNKLSHATMAHIIRNPKDKGYFCGNKVGTEDVFTKKSELDEKNIQLARCQSELERQSNMGDQVQQIRDSLERLAELNSPAMITEDFVKYCIDRINIRAEGDAMKLTISLMIGKTAEKRLNTGKEPSPQMGMVLGMRGLNGGLTAVRSWRVPPAR